MAKANIYSLGGTVQASKGTYLIRQADKKLLELCQQAEFAYILTSRQMGKSSLMISTASELKKISVKSVIIDLTGIGTQVSAEQWYLGLLLKIEEQLMLDTDVDQWWQANNNVGFTQRLTKFFQHVLLEEVTSPVVVFVDEIDTTLSLDFTDDFFAAIRYFYVARAQDAKFERLSFVLIGVATPGDLIRDPKRTPFNIGQRLDLTDFTFDEAIPLAEGLGLPMEPAQQLLRWVLEWTGGHPYLTQRLCSILSEQGKDSWSSAALEQVVSSTFFGDRSQQDNNLQFVRDMLTKRAPNKDQVLTVYREIHSLRHPVFDEEQSIIKSHLKLSGVVRREDSALRVRNRIYQEVFNAEWVENELGQMRPYSQALTAWLETNREDESRLLRGQALQDALDWAKNKSLNDEDYRFLAASQELDKREIQFALAETEKKAQQIISDAERKAKRTIRMGLGILSVAIVGVIAAGWYGEKLIKNAETATVLERQGNAALQLFDAYQIDGLILAIDAGQKLQKLVGKNTPIEKYLVTSPIVALNGILAHIQERNQLKGHTGSVNNANFSPDGKYIVTTSRDKTAKVWDKEGKLLATLTGHTGSVNNANFSPDGKYIVTTSEDKTAKVWDKEGKLLTTLTGHTGSVNNANFSPDGKYIVTTSRDKTAKVWYREGNLLTTLIGHTSSVNNVNFSPDGKYIVTASRDKTAKVWDKEGKLFSTLTGHTSSVNNANFSPDGKYIVTASADSTAKVWDREGKLLTTLTGHKIYVNNANFSPDGKYIVTTSEDKTAKVWDKEGKLFSTLTGHTSSVNNANFSPDGKYIVTASRDKTAKVWDREGNLLTTLTGHTGSVNNANFSPDGKYIVTASDDNTAKVWYREGNLLTTLTGHTSSVFNTNFSPDGKYIVTASGDNTAKVWYREGNLLTTLTGHTSSVINANFSPDGKYIVTTSCDKTAKVWDREGKLLTTLIGHTSSVNNANFSPDGKYIVTASGDNTAKVWNREGKLLTILAGYTGTVYKANFSPDGKYIVTTSDDSTAKVWDKEGKLLTTLTGHTSSVYKANFSPDGKYIVTASADNTAKVWQWKGLGELLNFGCAWLHDYLVINPQELQKLEVCQTPSKLKAAAPFLVKVGEEKARSGNFEEALATFRTAFKWNGELKFDPQKKAEEFENKGKAERKVSEGSSLVKEKKIKEAIAAYNQAQKLDPQVEIDVDAWDTLCKQGSLNKFAKEVMFACEKAVKVAPDNGNIRDSRGLARALTGDYKGAIADFEVYIAQTSDQDIKTQRQGWLKALRGGKNPFTKEELEKLR
ncbi:AAA-like domain-containing protein [Nostoc linckia FACHB-104]|nr:AAA-like domain-containing protein [Nostoc linckia FACHB-104]